MNCVLFAKMIKLSVKEKTKLFILIFGLHESFLWGHWYPCFGLLETSPYSFKARVGSLLPGRGVYVTYSLRFTSGETPADLLVASMAAELSLPHTCEALVGLETQLSCRHLQCEIRKTLYRMSYPGSANIKKTLKNAGQMEKSTGKMEKSTGKMEKKSGKNQGNFVSLEKWEPWRDIWCHFLSGCLFPCFFQGIPVSGSMFLPGEGPLSRGSTLDRNSPWQSPPYGKERAIRILLECILVNNVFTHRPPL